MAFLRKETRRKVWCLDFSAVSRICTLQHCRLFCHFLLCVLSSSELTDGSKLNHNQTGEIHICKFYGKQLTQ